MRYDIEFGKWVREHPTDVSAIGINALLDEIDRLNEKAVFIQFWNEDELPEDISDDVYAAMFKCSHVDGVRLFPYIEENGQKYFLVMLNEEA